jgi:uncharacterized protein YndB with AHSA1/START domain
MTDVASTLAGTDREIGRRRIAAGEARTALIRRRYGAPLADVWGVCTEPDRIGRWFLRPTGDLRPGGTFALEGNASGEILRCEPPHRLALSWVYGDRPADEVELRLCTAEDGGTALQLEHATVTGLVEWDGRLLDVLPDVGVGWEMALFALGVYLRGELPDDDTTAAFAEAPKVQDLAGRRGQAWADLVEAVVDTGGRNENASRWR